MPEIEIDQPDPKDIEVVPEEPKEKANDQGDSENEDFVEYSPVSPAVPIFPKKAIKKKVEGEVLLEYSITKEGFVKDIIVVEEDPEGYGFAEAAVKALSVTRYKPRKIKGEPVEVKQAHHRFVFKFGNGLGTENDEEN